MPKLPSAQNFGERPTPHPAGGVVPLRPTSGAEGAESQAAQRFADTMMHVSKEIERVQLQDDTLRAEDAFNQLRAKQLELTTGDDGFVNRKGADAVNNPLLDDYGKRLDQASKEIGDTLGNDRQRDLFTRRSQVSSLQFKQDVLNHVSHERNVYAENTFKATVDLELRSAVERYQDPAGIALSRERMMAAIDQEATRKGLPPEAVESAKRAQISNLHTNVASRFIAEDQFGQAESYIKTNKEELDIDDRLKLEGMLKSKRSEISSELRVEIADKMQDIEAMGQRGVVPPKGFISDADIDTAYANNGARAQQIKRRRDEAIRFASDAAGLHGLGQDDLVKIATESRVPQTTPENFAEAARHQDQRKAMAAQIYTQRQSAPIEYAAQRGVGMVNQIDFSDPQAIAAEIPNRIRTSKLMTDQYGSPPQLLTKTEAGLFASTLKQLPPQKRSEYFGSLYKASGNNAQAYKSVMGQIAPDDPVTAIAGEYAGKGYQLPGQDGARARAVSDLILAGQAILQPSSKEDGKPDKGSLLPMPSEKEMRSAFDGYVQTAYAGYPQARSDHYQAARAIYAKLSADAGDKDTSSLDPDRWETSMRMATGGIEKHNGAKIIMPYGYDRSTFKDELHRRIDAMEFKLPNKPDGLIERGNIDLSNRPRVENADGSISTVRSIGVNVDGKEVLLPTVNDDGRFMSDKEAVEQYRRTGKHLGIFKSPEASSAYAEALHQQQAALIHLPPGVTASDLKNLPLQSYGDGKYMFRSGDNVLGDKNKKPIVIDFNTPAPPKPPPLDRQQRARQRTGRG